MTYGSKGSSWTAKDLASYASTTGATAARSASAKAVYEASKLHDDLDPRKMKGPRESLASVNSPFPTSVVFGLDVTGSMNHVLKELAANGLPELMEGLFDLKTISDPQVMLAAYGDMKCGDDSPAQFGQFEINKLALDVIKKIHFEGGGGSNDSESTSAIWAFAHHMTRCASFEETPKRKGFIFTFGNDGLDQLRDEDMLYLTGNPQIKAITTEELYNRVSENWFVFHIHLEDDKHFYSSSVVETYRKVMGQNLLICKDIKTLTKLIVSTIDVVQGNSVKAAASRWNGESSIAVISALSNYSVAAQSGAGTGVVAL